MSLSDSDRLEALKLIEDYQSEGDTFSDRGCRPVTVQIGSVRDSNDMIQHDTLILKDACTGVIEELQDNGFKVSMSEDKGLYVSKH